MQDFFGERVYDSLDTATTIEPLIEAFQKSKVNNPDTRAIIVYAANAFESFLDTYATSKSVSLAGQNGILQKRNALSACLSKKHKGMML